MRRRSRNEGGAAAVEAALVTPIIVLLVLGMIEFAFVLRDYAVVTSNSRTGARIASTGAGAGPGTCDSPCTPANAPALAQMAADAIQRSGSAMPTNQINFIAVYQANDRGFPGSLTALPTGNDPCGGAGNCVVYRWVDGNPGRFRYSAGSWNSSQISACFPGTASAPLHRVGVSMRATHPMMTGVFGSQIVLNQYTVMNFEPLPTQTCKAGQHQ